MAPLVSTIEIDRAPKEVFDFATDPRRFPDWQRDIVRVAMLDATEFPPPRMIGGSERTMPQRITRDDPPHSWAAEGVDGPVRPNATVTVEPLDGGTRSSVTFTLDFAGHGVGVPIVPLVRRQARKVAPVSYRNLKELLESRDTV